MKISLSQFLLLKDSLKKNQIFESTVSSGSMMPLIGIGDNVIVKPLKTNPRRFDILVFFLRDQLICHYLHHTNALEISTKKYVTRPLSGAQDDLPIGDDQILGQIINFKISFWNRLKLSFRA